MSEQRDSSTRAPKAVGTEPAVSSERTSAKPPGADDYGEQDENGVDLSLLRYMLGLSPLERLQAMERHARDTALLYEWGQRRREGQFAGGR
ncbi:MAG TPA: hypothetical protein VG013_15615 [Gemmataceae bacterium]|jgi:hypothetical protein|nr:hypothetical protein [Gemmataceae bacterium]